MRADKGLISKIYRELLQLTHLPEINNLIKNGQRAWIDIFPKRMYRWLTDIWKYWTSLIIREMQIKTTIRYHLTPVRIANLSKSTNNKCWWGCRKKGNLDECWWDWKLVPTLKRTIWKLLKNLKTELSDDPANPLLDIYLKNTNLKR